MKNETKVELLVVVLLIGVGAWLRVVLQDLPNVAPVAASSLLAAVYFRRATWALAVPLLILAISDLFIGSYHFGLMLVVYGMLAVPVACRKVLQRHCSLSHGATNRRVVDAVLPLLKFLGCAVVASTLFFATTNFAHWWIYDMYPHTMSGLLECYVNALMFFRYTLIGDVVFSTVLFSVYATVHVMETVGVFRTAR